MNMTWEETIKQLESLYDHCENMRSGDNDFAVWERDCEAIKIALSALRPVSREQVWRGEWIDTNHRTSSCKCTKCGAVQEYETPFCPACGAPMTDKAVDMVMERLEALYGQENT